MDIDIEAGVDQHRTEAQVDRLFVGGNDGEDGIGLPLLEHRQGAPPGHQADRAIVVDMGADRLHRFDEGPPGRPEGLHRWKCPGRKKSKDRNSPVTKRSSMPLADQGSSSAQTIRNTRIDID
ncbi:hypothetical protein ACFS3C_08150 [Azotobacter vinelandii]